MKILFEQRRDILRELQLLFIFAITLIGFSRCSDKTFLLTNINSLSPRSSFPVKPTSSWQGVTIAQLKLALQTWWTSKNDYQSSQGYLTEGGGTMPTVMSPYKVLSTWQFVVEIVDVLESNKPFSIERESEVKPIYSQFPEYGSHGRSKVAIFLAADLTKRFPSIQEFTMALQEEFKTIIPPVFTPPIGLRNMSFAEELKGVLLSAIEKILSTPASANRNTFPSHDNIAQNL